MKRKKMEEKAVIRATLLKTEEGDFVPVKIVVTRFEKEVSPKRLEILVNPNRNLVFEGAAPYLSRKLLQMAPDVDFVRSEVMELTSGVPIYGSEEKEVRKLLQL